MKKTNIIKKISPIINIIITIIFTIGFFIIFDIFLDNVINKYNFFLILIIIFITIYLAGYIQTIIHELGHLVFGLITKYKFSSFRIGNIILVKENEKLKLKKIKSCWNSWTMPNESTRFKKRHNSIQTIQYGRRIIKHNININSSTN